MREVGDMRKIILGLVVAAAAAPAAQAQTPEAKTLAESRNNVGVAYDPLSGADFDGSGDAFSGTALQVAGVTPGANVSAEGFAFVWPDTASGQPDNVEAKGQSIAITAPWGATKLGVLAAATGGALDATLKLNYVDALGVTSVEEAKVTVGNWMADPTTGDVGPTGDVSSDFYVVSSAIPVPISTGVDAVTVPLDPNRRLVSVDLPAEARLHVFDLSTQPESGGGEEPPAATLPVRSTVVAFPAGNFTGFTPQTVVIQGQPADFLNSDATSPHDVTSVKRGPDYKRLFQSASVPGGTVTPIVGVENLPVGSYDFICSIHGTMKGTLTVQAAP